MVIECDICHLVAAPRGVTLPKGWRQPTTDLYICYKNTCKIKYINENGFIPEDPYLNHLELEEQKAVDERRKNFNKHLKNNSTNTISFGINAPSTDTGE